jgi:hypothetical protein
MKLGIMQPYFFPYVGYFSLIDATDKWIVFDGVQYIRHGWVNRNRILHPTEGWQYVIVPLKKHSRDALISEVEVAAGDDWKRRILAQLEHYKRRAPFYDPTVELVRRCLDDDEPRLARLNANILAKVCAHLGIAFDYDIFSEKNLPVGEINAPGEWALRVSQLYGASEYINPPGAKEIFDSRSYDAGGVALKFLEMREQVYDQRRATFEPSLSVIDVLMFNSTAQTRELMSRYVLTKG